MASPRHYHAALGYHPIGTTNSMASSRHHHATAGYHPFGADVQSSAGGGALSMYEHPYPASSLSFGAGAVHNHYAVSVDSFDAEENLYTARAHGFNFGEANALNFGSNGDPYAGSANNFNGFNLAKANFYATGTNISGADANSHAAGVHNFRAHGGGECFAPPTTTFSVAAGDGILPAERHARSAAAATSGAALPRDLFALIEKTTVVRVRRVNCGEVFQQVRYMLRQPRHHLYVAMDFEYAADASTNVGFHPISSIAWFEHLREFVNGGDVFQMGLVLAFEDQPESGLSSVIAMEIDFQFNMDDREYNQTSIDFLKGQKHDLDDHRYYGIMSEWVFAGLLRYLPVGDHTVTWISYHGDRDVGFLLRLLQAGGHGSLPADRPTFLLQVREKFPILYDVRVLGQIMYEGFRGKLTVLADEKHLNVVRVSKAHFAASDALLTLSCFFKIVHCSKHELHRLDARQNLLSGVEEYSMAIKCARHVNDDTIATFYVLGNNFDQQSMLIEELVTSNFRIIALEVLLPPYTPGTSGLEDNYHTMKSSVSSVSSLQVVLGFMNPEGAVAYGRMWRFHLCHGDGSQHAEDSQSIHPLRFAKLLALCGATHDASVIWTTYCGAEEVGCLVQSFLKPGDLPNAPSSYIELRQELFPALCDLSEVAQLYQDINAHLTGCKEDLYTVAYALRIGCGGGTQGLSKALIILRCYNRFSELPGFAQAVSAVQGKLHQLDA